MYALEKIKRTYAKEKRKTCRQKKNVCTREAWFGEGRGEPQSERLGRGQSISQEEGNGGGKRLALEFVNSVSQQRRKGTWTKIDTARVRKLRGLKPRGDEKNSSK